MNQRQLDWLLGQGISIDALINPVAVDATDDALHFPDYDTFWNPKTGQFISSQWCLGDQYDRLSDDPLVIHETPIHWLRASRHGIVIIDWSRIFEMLRDEPDISCPGSLKQKYVKFMRPQRTPRVSFT